MLGQTAGDGLNRFKLIQESLMKATYQKLLQNIGVYFYIQLQSIFFCIQLFVEHDYTNSLILQYSAKV